jgi:protein-export membrane protein SecD
MSGTLRWFILILVISIFAGWVVLPDTQGIHIDTDNDGVSDINLNVQQSLGLDLVGGLRVLLQAELPPSAFSIDDLRETANNVARRVNALGVSEPTVQVQGSNRILVELPGVTNPEQAIDTIRQTALLEFVNFSGLGGQVREFEGKRVLTTQQVIIRDQRGGEDTRAAGEPDPLVNPLTSQPFETVMTGAGLQAASAELSQFGQWQIAFQMNTEGAITFGNYTEANIGQPMAIVLDGVVLSAPRIDSRIDGSGVITGNFTETEARQLALQLRSGALRIPLRVESTERVGATLGQQSVNLSIRAGVIGVIVVLLFMVIYYRVPGVAADMALLVFILLNMALFKLIPVTLTLPAITGFLISIGTAVDGNILIFERIKEELRAGRPMQEAVEAGFDRAWQSIRDSNFSTILICLVLFFFGQTPGASLVAGFAVTLAIGLVVNLFTAVIVTRTFLSLLVAIFQRPIAQRLWLLGI